MSLPAERAPLGAHSAEGSLNTHDTMGEHATKSYGDWLRCRRVAPDQHLIFPEAHEEAYLSGQDGFFFRAEQNDAPHQLLHGFTAVRDFQDNSAVIDSWYTGGLDEAIDDAVHYLWLRRGVPILAQTALGFMKAGEGVKQAIFGVDIDEPAARLLESFGVQLPDGRWAAPLATTIQPPVDVLDRLLAQKPAAHRNFAVVDIRSEEETVIHFTHKGVNIGRLVVPRELHKGVLLDAGEQQLELAIPEAVLDSRIDQMLREDQVVNALALTALIRQLD